MGITVGTGQTKAPRDRGGAHAPSGGDIEVKRVIFVEPDILIETDEKGKTNLEFETDEVAEEEMPATGEEALPAMSFDRLVINKGRLTYKDGATGETYTVAIDRLAAMAAGGIDSPVELELDGNYDGVSFKLAGTLGPLTALIDPGLSWPLKLKADALDTTLILDGMVRDVLNQQGIDMGFEVRVQDLTKLEKLAETTMPVRGPIAISGRATDPAASTYKVSALRISFGESDLDGSLEVSLAGEIPSLMAALSSKVLDLRPVLEGDEGEADEKPAKVGKNEKVFSADPIPLDALKQADVSIKIRVKKLLLPQLALNDLNSDLTIKDGRLAVKPFKATIGGGTLDGRITLHQQGKAAVLVTALKGNQIDLGKMLKELEITDQLEGKLDVNIDLKGSGGSVAALMAQLNGNTNVVMGKGRVNNKYIGFAGADLSAGIFRLINPATKDESFTTINCFVSRFDIRDGLADTTALVFDSTLMSVIGDGNIDLKTEKLDLSLNPVPKKGVDAKGMGKINLSLGELAAPFKLGGTLAGPSLAIDRRKAAVTVGKAVGGIALFGPIGIAAVLVSADKADENLCLIALEAAKTGVKPEKEVSVTTKATEGIKKGVRGVGGGIKKLFGK